jgi:hypothetical protein
VLHFFASATIFSFISRASLSMCHALILLLVKYVGCQLEDLFLSLHFQQKVILIPLLVYRIKLVSSKFSIRISTNIKFAKNKPNSN